MKILDNIQAKNYFYNLHDVDCNQKYNETLPYSFHLEMVGKQALLFEHHIPNDRIYHSTVWAAIHGHDSIKYARLTYNDISKRFGELVADIIYLCTEDKGKTHSDRKSEKWYEELRTNKLAVFVKLCDIIANVKFGLLTNSGMFDKYRSEYAKKVRPMLYITEYDDMFIYLDKLFEVKL